MPADAVVAEPRDEVQGAMPVDHSPNSSARAGRWPDRNRLICRAGRGRDGEKFPVGRSHVQPLVRAVFADAGDEGLHRDDGSSSSACL